MTENTIKINWQQVGLYDGSYCGAFPEAVTVATAHPQMRGGLVSKLREYRDTNSIYGWFLSPLSGQEHLDASEQGPTVEQIDWTGFPEDATPEGAVAEARTAWEDYHADHLVETGHRAGVDRIYEGDRLMGVRIGCVDDQGNAVSCGTWETITF